jgi:ParB family chromosome partitioning protein
MKQSALCSPKNGYSIVTGKPMTALTAALRTAEPFKSLFPIRETDLEKITANMKQKGFDHAHPIIVWAGHKFTVVDGHTRLAAARRLGIGVIPIVVREFANENEALEYAIDSQRNRRNLTDAELLRCLSELDKRKKAGRPKNGSTDPGKSADRTVSLLGISRAKVERLRAVADHGTETIKLAVLSGDLTVNRAYIITMEARRMDNCKTETDLKSTRLAILEKSISKGIKERTDLELRKHPDVRYAPAELHAMKGKIISKLDEALGKLKKGKK